MCLVCVCSVCIMSGVLYVLCGVVCWCGVWCGVVGAIQRGVHLPNCFHLFGAFNVLAIS